MKPKTDELETESKIKNIRDLYRDVSDFKKGYQPRTNSVKDEKGVLVTGFHRILVKWRKHFSQLLNVHGFNDVRQTEIRITEPLVPELNNFEFEIPKKTPIHGIRNVQACMEIDTAAMIPLNSLMIQIGKHTGV